MGNKDNWHSTDVLCPFYRSHRWDAKSIGCEGLIGRSKITHYFSSQREQRIHLARCCASKYQSCPHYKALMKTKYSDLNE